MWNEVPTSAVDSSGNNYRQSAEPSNLTKTAQSFLGSGRGDGTCPGAITAVGARNYSNRTESEGYCCLMVSKWILAYHTRLG